MTPRTHRRVPGRHRPAARPRAGPARALRPLSRRRATSGRTRTTTRGSPSTRRPDIPRELYIPDLDRAARPDRQRVDLRHRRARRRLHEVLRGDRSSRSGAATRPSCAAPTPGATTTATSTRTTPRPPTTPTSSSARRTSRDGAGRQLWDFKDGDLRGDRPHLLKVYGYRAAAAGTRRVGAYFVAQSGQPWETWSYEPYIAPDDVHERHQPLRGAGRLAPAPTRTGSSTSTTRRTSGFGERLNLQLAADLFNVFNKQTGLQLRAGASTTRRSATPRIVLRPAAPPARGALAVLTTSGASEARRDCPPGLLRGVRSRSRRASRTWRSTLRACAAPGTAARAR